MSMTTRERTEFLHAVMITALEGGVSYWSVADDIVRHDDDDLWYASYVLYCSEGGKEALACGNAEDNPCKGHKVTRGVISVGLSKIRGGTADTLALNAGSIGHIIAAEKENDGGEIDAGDADCIVQAGIFGKVVYG